MRRVDENRENLHDPETMERSIEFPLSNDSLYFFFFL